jgi:hypothetical protein
LGPSKSTGFSFGVRLKNGLAPGFPRPRKGFDSLRLSAHPEAGKPEEQHLNAQHAHTQLLLAFSGCSLN